MLLKSTDARIIRQRMIRFGLREAEISLPYKKQMLTIRSNDQTFYYTTKSWQHLLSNFQIIMQLSTFTQHLWPTIPSQNPLISDCQVAKSLFCIKRIGLCSNKQQMTDSGLDWKRAQGIEIFGSLKDLSSKTPKSSICLCDCLNLGFPILFGRSYSVPQWRNDHDACPKDDWHGSKEEQLKYTGSSSWL